MKRVISVNLSGNAIALDEDAYERLRAYITLTESRLGRNPDRAEIIADLERAIVARLGTERTAADSGSVSDTVMESTLVAIGAVEHSEAPLGNGLTANSATPVYVSSGESDYTRLPVFLLCLFVGWLGVHRFFVGKIGTGLLQLVTIGGLGIWTLVDFILILCGEFRDKEGRKIVRWT